MLSLYFGFYNQCSNKDRDADAPSTYWFYLLYIISMDGPHDNTSLVLVICLVSLAWKRKEGFILFQSLKAQHIMLGRW